VNNSVPLGAGDIYDTPEGWCTDTAALSRWLGVSFTADPYNLLLRLESKTPLPFMDAIERRSRAARLHTAKQFDLSQLPQADIPYRAWRTPAVDMVVNFQLDKTPGAHVQSRLNYELYASGEIAGASVDARLASDTTGLPESLRLEAYRYDPNAGLLGPLRATRVAIGDVEADGASLAGRSGVGRGAMITNRPADRPADFSQTTIRGAMPTGWDAELYRNGQLLAYQGESTDGRYEFPDVDLLYGDNDFEVVLHGPQGQIRREASSFPVGVDSISPGKTYYWAAAIQQGRDLLEFGREIVDPNTGWRGGVGVERGFDRRTSAAITAQTMVIDGTRNTYLELNLRRALGSMLMELSAADSLGRGMAYRAHALGAIGKVRFDAQTLWVTGGYQSDLIEPSVRQETRLSAETSLKAGLISLPIGLEARHQVLQDGSKVNEWLIRGSIIAPKISFTAEFGQIATDTTYGPPGSEDGLQLNFLANTRLGRLDLRGESQFRLSGPNKGFYSGNVVGELPISERSDLRGEVEYIASQRAANFSLGYVHDFKKFALRGEGRFGTDGTVGFGLSLNASVGPDPAHGGIRFSREKLAQTGQTAVTVFLDDNGDGQLSPGEKPVADVAVEAGLHSTDGTTDKSGRALIEGMKPYIPVLVSIDTGSLPDPYLQPQGKGIVVTPRPGVTASVVLPLSPTGEIEGTIEDLAGSPRGGVKIELVDALGTVAATTQTEYDGYFLFETVPYGRYTLRLAVGSAKALSAAAGLASGVALSHGNDVARLGILRLKPDGIARNDGAPAPAGKGGSS
jgi:hypothetical protein